MKTQVAKSQENKRQVTGQNKSQRKSSENSGFHFADNRPETVTQRKLNVMANNSQLAQQAAQLKAVSNSTDAVQLNSIEEEELLQGKFKTVQRKGKNSDEPEKRNNAGLPDGLKTGIESLSGMPMDDVRVHYNSATPEQLQAHAFAQGTDIHVAPGQEQHLPHEAWHVVQQKKGRVKPTMQMKGKVKINDDAGLEQEADRMGARALATGNNASSEKPVVQLGKKKDAIKRAKKNNPNGIQHHLRPEYQQQNERQMELVRGGVSRKDAKRQARQEERARKR